MYTLDTPSAVTRDLLVPLALAPDALACDWRALLEEVPTGIFVARAGRFLFVNHRLARMFGYDVPGMLSEVGSLDLAAPEFRQQVLSQVQHRQIGFAEPPYDIQCLRRDGSRFDARISGMRVLIDGQETDLVALQDVSETLQAVRDASARAAQLAEADMALRMSQFMLDHSPVPIVAVDTEGRLRYVNEATAHMLGHARQAMLQLSIFDIAPHRRPDMWINSFETLKRIGSRVLPSDWRDANGRILPVELNATYMEYDAERYIVIYATDVTERMAVQEQALRLTSFDDVTGLPNRQFLQERLRSEGQLAVAEGRRIGLLAVEVNEVQQINETMGYAVGDQLLMTLTRRMATGLKGTDTLAYMGEGEFVFLLTHQCDVNDDTALQLGRHLLDVLTDPIEVGSEQVRVTCDIGVVIFPQDANEPDHVLRQAQSAMRMAEARGHNQICFYTPEANARVGEKLALEAALQGALDRQELYLVYQPQVDLTTGKVIGVEALARWRHPDLGEVPATDFIALAEETGMIFPLGMWSLQSAL